MFRYNRIICRLTNEENSEGPERITRQHLDCEHEIGNKIQEETNKDWIWNNHLGNRSNKQVTLKKRKSESSPGRLSSLLDSCCRFTSGHRPRRAPPWRGTSTNGGHGSARPRRQRGGGGVPRPELRFRRRAHRPTERESLRLDQIGATLSSSPRARSGGGNRGGGEQRRS
jgi:hypothetical protein